LFSEEPPAFPNLIVSLTFTLLFPITVLTIILLWTPSIRAKGLMFLKGDK